MPESSCQATFLGWPLWVFVQLVYKRGLPCSFCVPRGAGFSMIPCLLSFVVWAYWVSMESWSHGSPLGSERYWVTLGSEREVRTREMSSFIAGDKSCFFPFLVQLGGGPLPPLFGSEKMWSLNWGFSEIEEPASATTPEALSTLEPVCSTWSTSRELAGVGEWDFWRFMGMVMGWLASGWHQGWEPHKASRRQQTENSSPTKETPNRVKNLHTSVTQSAFSCPNLSSHLFFLQELLYRVIMVLFI